jgi:ribosomal-protein-alanine N-acetyltransferase
MSLSFMQALARRDLASAEAEVGASIPQDMPDELEHFLQYRIADLTADPSVEPWLGRSIVAGDSDGRRVVIGTVGFHGRPDEAGRVEIGYRVWPEYRRQGVATEVVRAMFEWAYREHGVTRFRAATAPRNVASQGVLAKFGFRQVGAQIDDYDGLELVFDRDDWTPAADGR